MRSATGVACPSSTSFKVSFEPSDIQIILIICVGASSNDDAAADKIDFHAVVRIMYSTKAVSSGT